MRERKPKEWYVWLTKGTLLTDRIEEWNPWPGLEGLVDVAVVPWKGRGGGT